MALPLRLELTVPEYVKDKEPNYADVGAPIDRLLREHFLGQRVVIRCIGSQDHPRLTLDALAQIVLETGSDKYEPGRTGVGYGEGHNGQRIDFFGTAFEVAETTNIFAQELLKDFYHGARGDRGFSVRIDLVIVYDRAQLVMIEHLYGDQIESDGFAFSDPAHKREALMGLVKIR